MELAKENSVFGHSVLSVNDVALSMVALQDKHGKFQGKHIIDSLWFLCAKRGFSKQLYIFAMMF